MANLEEKYQISTMDKLICRITKFFHSSGRPTNYIYKRSYKKYGRKHNLARYYLEKYRGIEIGKYSYGYRDINLNSLIKSVGSFTSIAIGSACVAGNHNMNYVTTSPILTHSEFGFGAMDSINIDKSIVIGNDVWIGAGCLLFPNIRIGDGAVIGAGSIIRKDVPPYAKVVGVDRIIGYRFSPDIIEKLLAIKWWNWDDEKIRDNVELMKDIDAFIEKYYRD